MALEIDGVSISPGEVIVADVDGVVAFAPEQLASVCAAAAATIADETEIESRLPRLRVPARLLTG